MMALSSENIYSHISSRLSKYPKVVIWGLRNSTNSHRYIHSGFFNTLKKINFPVYWVDDIPENKGFIKQGDLVIAVNVANNYLPIVQGVDYCLHNFQEDKLDMFPRHIRLQVYTDKCSQGSIKIASFTFVDKKNKLLFQPWGTNLLPQEFMSPVKYNIKHPLVFFIGSVWNNELNQGNIHEIKMYKDNLRERGLFLKCFKNVPEKYVPLIQRSSRVSLAIAGRWQVENNYLPCRFFKNVSYGLTGLSNVAAFDEFCGIKGLNTPNIEELIDNWFTLTDKQHKEIVINQQQIIAQEHTYLSKLLNIADAFERIY